MKKGRLMTDENGKNRWGKWRRMWRAVSVGVMTVCVAVMGGCGFNSRESTTYTVPNWTGNGRIIAGKEYMRSHSNLISNSVLDEARSSIVVMDADGGNEHELFEAGYSSLIAMSASGNVVAYISGRLHVMVNDGGWKEKWSVDINEGGAQNYDNIQISPDETKIYVSEGRYQFKVFAIDGRLLTHQVIGGGGGFKSNTELIIQSTGSLDEGGALVSYFNLDSFQLIKTPYVKEPEVYLPSENSIVSDGGSYFISKLFLSTGSVTTYPISYSPYSYTDFTGRHLSPDGTKVVMSYDSVDDVGIYILDILQNRMDRLR